MGLLEQTAHRIHRFLNPDELLLASSPCQLKSVEGARATAKRRRSHLVADALSIGFPGAPSMTLVVTNARLLVTEGDELLGTLLPHELGEASVVKGSGLGGPSIRVLLAETGAVILALPRGTDAASIVDGVNSLVKDAQARLRSDALDLSHHDPLDLTDPSHLDDLDLTDDVDWIQGEDEWHGEEADDDSSQPESATSGYDRAEFDFEDGELDAGTEHETVTLTDGHAGADLGDAAAIAEAAFGQLATEAIEDREGETGARTDDDPVVLADRAFGQLVAETDADELDALDLRDSTLEAHAGASAPSVATESADDGLADPATAASAQTEPAGLESTDTETETETETAEVRVAGESAAITAGDISTWAGNRPTPVQLVRRGGVVTTRRRGRPNADTRSFRATDLQILLRSDSDAVRAEHLPSGISVIRSKEGSRAANRSAAIRALRAKVLR